MLLTATKGCRILDLGCGTGSDTQCLLNDGYHVVSVDFSREALSIAHRTVGGGCFVQSDLRSGLPFRSSHYQLILASLVLHYFTWSDTVTIVEDIRRCLHVNGCLLARLNSVEDVNFGAKGNPEIERGLYFVNGISKRFFDRDDVERLFADGWQIFDLRKQTTRRADMQKHLLEVRVVKA